MLLIVSTAVGLAIAEGVLRWHVGPPVHWKFPQEHYVNDPELGFHLAPAQEAFTHDAPVRTNALGLRDREYAPAVPPGTRRILALGDSQTFGNGLPREDSWPELLERELDTRDEERAWQVVNAGWPASDTWQHVRLLDRLSEVYRYDRAVLAFYVNDVAPLPGGGVRGLGAAGRTNTWQKRVGYLLKRSALFTAAWQARGPLTAWLQGRTLGDREARVISGEPDPVVEAGWEEVDRSLGRARATATAAGAELTLLVLPRRDQVSGANPHTAYNRRLAELGRKHGIGVVDVLPTLREAYAAHGQALFIPWDGHNSALANAVIARRLADALLDG